MQKIFAVSDVHGYATLLKKALADAGYDPECKDHLLICCGDIFDRGPENYDVLRFFERIERKVLIMGNHEENFLQILNTGRLNKHDFTNGTVETIREFFGKYSVMNTFDPVDFSGRTSMVNRVCDIIGEMKNYYETEHYVFVHGWLPNAGGSIIPDWRNASAQQWRCSRRTWWTRGALMPGYNEDKIIVCGHYPTVDAEIYYGRGYIVIDDGIDITKKPNVLVLEDRIIDEEDGGNGHL